MTDLLLPTALLWFDDSDKSLEEKVKQAAARYRYKHGKPPTLCFVHPDALGDSGEARQVGGVEVRAGRAVLRDHFWIGREASAEQEQLDELRKHVAGLVHCPDCPDQGWYAVGDVTEWEQVQCEFCWTTPNSFFNHRQEKQAEVQEHIANGGRL